MKKSWIIVLAFVFLYSAVPAFSAPLPVPSTLCLESDGGEETFSLFLETKGEIGDVEYFDVTGSWVDYACVGACVSLIGGSAHRKGRKKLHLGLTGAFDDGSGPGGGGTMYQTSFDITWNLKKEKGDYSYFYIFDGELSVKAFTDSMSGTGTLTPLDCSDLPSPSEPPW